MYRHTSIDLFIDGEVIKSREGTIQGDPLAMAIYAIATIALIKKLQDNGTEKWYADDAASMGKISQTRDWWKKLLTLGPIILMPKSHGLLSKTNTYHKLKNHSKDLETK